MKLQQNVYTTVDKIIKDIPNKQLALRVITDKFQISRFQAIRIYNAVKDNNIEII